MRAMVIHEYGPASVLVEGTLPEPTVGPRDVLIDVKASSVNPIDTKIRSGAQRGVIRYALPQALGLDVSGVVLEVGSAVTRFKAGDEVYSSPTHRRQGCYAERVVIAEPEIALKPKNISHEEAASIPLVGLTAWQCLMPTLEQRGDHRVFIQAGSGGVGSFAIQLAKHHEAWVATTASERNHELVTRLGADLAIDYHTQRFEDVLHDIDVVLDALGTTERDRAMDVLRQAGRLANIRGTMPESTKKYGPLLGIIPTFWDMASFIIRGRLRGLRPAVVLKQCDGEQLGQITALIEAGAIKPVVDRVLPMTDAAEAHAYLETGRARGKVVLAGF